MTSSEQETLLNDVKAFVSSHCLLSITAEAYAASDDKERFLTDLLTKTLAEAKYGSGSVTIEEIPHYEPTTVDDAVEDTKEADDAVEDTKETADAVENRKRSVEELDGDAAAQQEAKKSKPTPPPTLPMPRTSIKNCDTEIETVGKYDDEADMVDTYGKEELKALCERLCAGDEDCWRSLHVLTQADLYNYVFLYFCVKWTELKCLFTSGYKNYAAKGWNTFDRKVWDNVLEKLADTTRTDERTLGLRECFRQDKMRLTNVSLRALNTKYGCVDLPDTEFILGPHNKDEVTLRFFRHY